MYLPWPIGYGPNGLGLAGLGDAETAQDCPEPVSTEERDELKAELDDWCRDYWVHKGDHWHEGHPDLKAAIDDLMPRMGGLRDRPKLLRCSKEARNKARTWLGQLKDLLRKVKSDPVHYGGYTYVNQPFDWAFYNGPVYHIRTWDQVRAAQGGTTTTTAPPATSEPTTEAPGAAAPAPIQLPPELEGVWTQLTTGEVFGIPKAYLVYGVLGLMAYRFVFGRR